MKNSKNSMHLQGNLIGQDVAGNDRSRMLCLIPKPKKLRDGFITPGVKASKVWNQDVSGSDRRSVKAQFAGRGDYRPLWWKLNVLVHKLFNRAATTEEIMYNFHKRHHGLTILWLRFLLEIAEVAAVIDEDGAAAGWRTKREQMRRRAHRD